MIHWFFHRGGCLQDALKAVGGTARVLVWGGPAQPGPEHHVPVRPAPRPHHSYNSKIFAHEFPTHPLGVGAATLENHLARLEHVS